MAMRIPTAFFTTATLLVALAGCAGPSSVPPSLQSTTAVTILVEKEGKFIAVVGPRRQHAEPFLGVPGTNYHALRSWIDRRNGEAVHQLYVEDSYFGAERNWAAARDAKGQELRFIAINKNEITCDNGCSYAEEFAAALPEALLRANPQGKLGGFAITFAARSGAQQTIVVPGDLVAKQLAAIADARTVKPVAAAAAPPPNPVR